MSYILSPTRVYPLPSRFLVHQTTLKMQQQGSRCRDEPSRIGGTSWRSEGATAVLFVLLRFSKGGYWPVLLGVLLGASRKIQLKSGSLQL
jgi:hypothetical protein